MQSHLLIATTIEYTDEVFQHWAGSFGIEQLNFELIMKNTFGGMKD